MLLSSLSLLRRRRRAQLLFDWWGDDTAMNAYDNRDEIKESASTISCLDDTFLVIIAMFLFYFTLFYLKSSNCERVVDVLMFVCCDVIRDVKNQKSITMPHPDLFFNVTVSPHIERTTNRLIFSAPFLPSHRSNSHQSHSNRIIINNPSLLYDRTTPNPVLYTAYFHFAWRTTPKVL
jgi:hypothetical protein